MTDEFFFESSAASQLGPRAFQNDSYYAGRRVVALADGMGAAPEARIAADLVIDCYVALGERSGSPLDALLSAPRLLADQLAERGSIDGSTAVAAVLDGRLLWLSSVGDSRIVVFRNGAVQHRSRLHNRAAEKLEFDPVAALPPGSTAALTRMIARGHREAPEVAVLEVKAGDVVVLMSDGVDTLLHLRALAHVVATSRPGRAAGEIMAVVVAAGLTDNASCVVGVVRASPSHERSDDR